MFLSKCLESKRVITPHVLPMDLFCSTFWNATAKKLLFFLIQDARSFDSGKFCLLMEGVISCKEAQLLNLMMYCRTILRVKHSVNRKENHCCLFSIYFFFTIFSEFLNFLLSRPNEESLVI